MTKCYCERCSDTPKHSYTKAYQLECLAKYLMKMTLQDRRTFLSKLSELKRKELEAELMKLHISKKAVW